MVSMLERLLGDEIECRADGPLPTLIKHFDDIEPCESPFFDTRQKGPSQRPFVTKNKRDIYRNTRGGGRRK